MPAIGNTNNFRVQPPKPGPRVGAPPTHTDASSGGYQFGRVAAYNRAQASAPPSHTDVTSGGYNFHQANAYKQTPQYRAAVAQVFRAQPPPQKAAIIRGLVKQNAFNTPEFQAIHDQWAHLPTTEMSRVAQYAGPSMGAFISAGEKGVNLGGMLGSALHFLSPANNPIYKGSKSGTGAGGVLGTVTPFGGPKGAEQVLGNLGKDAVNLPAEAFATVGTVAGDLFSGKPGKLASDLLSPIGQMVSHPSQAFYQHPLDTYLALTGILHGITRPLAGGVRALAPESRLGRALSLQRPDVALTGKLTHARPTASPYPLIQMAQKIADRARYAKDSGSLHARSQALQDKLTALETSREVGMIERVRRANRDAASQQRLQSVQPSRLARAAGQTARALKPGREAITIPGARALALIPDATLRSPATAAADLAKYIRMASGNRADLLDSPLLKEHDQNIAALNKVLGDVNSRKVKPAELFTAAKKYSRDYNPLQAEAAGFGQFGSRSQAALDQRMLGHYAILHMGAKYDPEAGALLRNGSRLSNDAIRAHMAANGVGHELAFTSDKPHGNSAFYVSSERRPLPEGASNTYFAYTHGLTDTSHEALLRQHVRMQGVVDAHKAQNRLIDQLAVQKQGGGFWSSYKAAQGDAKRFGGRLVPIRLSQPFHPPKSLAKALEGVHPAMLDEEAALHGLDLSTRLKDSGPGRYALISKVALDRIEQHRSAITPQLGQRVFTSLNSQFRRVALSTSAKHVPGVASEQVIRDISSGTGLSSWITGHRILRRIDRAGAEGRNVRTRVTGGQLAGATQMATRHFVAERYQGTSLYPVLKGFERVMRQPGARHLATAWNAWTTFAIGGTKRVLEEQHQVADLGKFALRDFASSHGPFFKALRLQGQMAEDAAKGIFDPAKQRQFRAYTEQVRGRWTDLTPHGQMAVMYSPFGLWWMNSVRYLSRMWIDQPVKLGALASATVGTEKQRQAHGLDMFMKGALPPYMQGGIPLGGGRVLAQNYYSPFGVVNDPLETAGSLIEPWATQPMQAAGGVSWLWKPLESPGDPHGRKSANFAERGAVILNSLLVSFLPLYMKAQQVAEGGASAYDTSTAFSPQTKTPGKGPVAGLTKALKPYRQYDQKAPSASGTFSPSSILRLYEGGASSGTADPNAILNAFGG